MSFIQKFSFHGGHSGQFCSHAKDNLEDIVLAYIENGYSHLGLSEHMPRPSEYLYLEESKSGDTENQSKNLYQKFKNYIIEAKRLQKEYANKINILVGFETEYYSDEAIELVKELREAFKVDYIVGSVHHVAGIPSDYSLEFFNQIIKKLGSIEQVMLAYYEHQYEVIWQLKPEIIGHFDLIKLFAKDFELTQEIKKAIKRNIEAGIKAGSLFEINLRAFKKGLLEPYPSIEILEYMQNLGAKITLGDDSHGIEDINRYSGQLSSILKNIKQLSYLERNGSKTIVKNISI